MRTWCFLDPRKSVRNPFAIATESSLHRPGFSDIAPIVGRTKELMREDRCGVFGGEEGDSCCVLLVVGRETNVPSPYPADQSYTDTLNTYSNSAGFSTQHWTD